jgi:ribose transport system substrate-binding protein
VFTHLAYAQVVIGIVGKTKNDSFYKQSYKGCLAFAKLHSDLTCVYDGPNDYQDIRAQPLIINALVKTPIDGLIVSITDSNHLVNRSLKSLYKQNIPVITYDSDLLPHQQQFRLAYVGSNNFDFGIALGEHLKTYANHKENTLCLQSGHKTSPNLNERIAGVRFALSGQSEERLSGQNGWSEYMRCPLYTLGKRSQSLFQLQHILKMDYPPLFLAVAGFAQFNPDYITTIAPFKNKLDSDKAIVVSADTEPMQLTLLANGLSNANIGQDPFEMGRLSTQLMYNYIVNGKKPLKDQYYTGFHICTKENINTCTANH